MPKLPPRVTDEERVLVSQWLQTPDYMIPTQREQRAIRKYIAWLRWLLPSWEGDDDAN